MASDARSRRSSLPRSATSPGSAHPRRCAHGPGSRPAIASPTPRSPGDASRNRVPTIVRWAALEAVVRYHGGERLRIDFHRIAERRGKNKARVAVARKLLTLVYYGLRDGEIRCLREQPVAA